MPYQDRTGPKGEGSKTGLGLGKCKTESKNETETKTPLKKIFGTRKCNGVRGGRRGKKGGQGRGRNKNI